MRQQMQDCVRTRLPTVWSIFVQSGIFRHNLNNDGFTNNTLVSIYITTMAKHGLSDDEVGDLKEAFSMFDIDGDGKFFHSGGYSGLNVWCTNLIY